MYSKRFDDEELESQVRFVISRLAYYLQYFFRLLGQSFDQAHDYLKLSSNLRQKTFKPSVLSPLGFLLIASGFYYLLQVDTIFAPFYIVYFFLFVMLMGFFLIKNG